MLRKSIKRPPKKFLGVPPLCECDVKQVLVEIKDPLTGDVIGSRKECVSQVRELDNRSLCSKESADLYSIENLQRAGISPVTIGRGSYILNSLDNVEQLEDAAADLLDIADSKPQVSPTSTEPANVEPSKTE